MTIQREQILNQTREYFIENNKSKPFIPGETYIPVTAKLMDAEDAATLVDASLDMWLTAGRYSREFESTLPGYFGRKTGALLVNSGSSANLLAVSALSSPQFASLPAGGAGPRGPIEPGSEVITLAAGFPTTVNPIIQNGWVPVFVDIDLTTLNGLPEAIMAARTPKTRAVILAHTLGNPFRADKLAEWCHREGLYFIEDCCDALGAKIGGQPVGSFGDYATISFYPAHHITMGEGGAVMSRDGRFKKIAESFRDWGRDCWCETGKDNTCKKRFGWQLGDLPDGYDHKYTYSHIGYNLKVTDMQAALGVSQLKKVDRYIEIRKRNWKFIYDGIKSSPTLKEHFIPVEATPGTEPSWFGFPLYCHDSLNREAVVRFLEEKKVGSRLLFAGNIIRQPAYKNAPYRVHGELKNSDYVMKQLFWLGVHPVLDVPRMNYMLEMLEKAITLKK